MPSQYYETNITSNYYTNKQYKNIITSLLFKSIILCWYDGELVVQNYYYLPSMNKYEILDRIGEGEYGVVLKGRNKQTNEMVAIKKFKEDDTDEENKRVILRQVKILKTLNHQNIIELKEAFRKKGKIYLVCEYVQKNLLEILEEAPITPQQVRHYTYHLLKGIAYMHSINIIHRDVKPENVLVSKQGAVKICDLGFARSIPSNKIMTDYVATRWYRPPELLIGRDDYDKSIDIWSIGCVMAEIIDGEPLFPGENDLDQLYLIQKCLGPLIAQHQQHFLKNPKFIGMKFPQIHNIESIERRYFGKVDKQGLDLMKRMLKMDPRQRITAQEALNHPYFQRGGSFSQIQIKKSKAQYEERRTDDHSVQFHPNHSNNLIANQKSPLPPNNFLDQKIILKDQKIGTNKVTGLLRLKKPPTDNVSVLRQNNIIKQEQPHAKQMKGKSLGSKKVQVKEKCYAPLTDKKGRGLKSRVEVPKMQYLDPVEDEYYQQKWQDQGNQSLQRKKQKAKDKQIDSPMKKEDIRKSKILSKNYRKDNFNIVFNNNTYNLNIADPFN